MDKQQLQLDVSTRSALGTSASRRARRADSVPGIVYGGSQHDPLPISMVYKEITKAAENELFHSQIIDLKIDASQTRQVILKQLQRHPVKGTIMHADFQNISADTKVSVSIPLHFSGEAECVGVKQQGGMITHHLVEVDVVSLPYDLPEFIEVDVSKLEIGQIIHLSELALPEGVQVAALLGADSDDKDGPVVSVAKQRGSSSVASDDTEVESEDAEED